MSKGERMSRQERETKRNNLKASQANLLESLIKLCKTMWESECMNRDCEECHIGREKKSLKEEVFYIFS